MPRTFYSPESSADELSFLNSELGYALFHPGMPDAQPPVTIGDVGTIQEGSFIRFFNTFSQATDEINNTDARVPVEFEPVAQVNRRTNSDASYSPGVFGSKGVTQLNLDVGAGFPNVAGADIRTRFRIAFRNESDVALMTKWKSKASNAVFIQPLAEYFLRNHQRFLDHIRSVHGSGTIRSDELVFVTGTLMSGDWVMARASTGSEEFNIGFDCGYTGIGGVHVHWNYTSNSVSVLPSREGPDRPSDFDYSTAPQFTQSIFLKRLRIFDRSVLSWLRQKLFITAGDSVEEDLQQLHMKKKVVDANNKSILTPITSTLVRKTNLLVVYIFEKSDADLLLIQEDDIHKAIPESTRPEDISDALEDSFNNGSVFVDILSEISQEIGKKVAAISTRPSPLYRDAETVVVDDTLEEIIDSRSHDDKDLPVVPTTPADVGIISAALERTAPRIQDEGMNPPPTMPRAGSRQFFNSSSNVYIEGGTFHLHEPKITGIDLLKQGASPGAFHNSAERFDPPKCHPGTRLAILEAIMAWINDGQRTSFIMWLYGPAGSGKSAIAQTIAELCYKSEDLAASFFWSRSAPGRNDEKHLIATLAFQLIIAFPKMRSHVEQALEINPLLLSLSLEAQMNAVIVKPLEQAFLSAQEEAEVPISSKVIILDGLDECGTPKIQRYILETISSVVQKFPTRIVFVITSRSELTIREAFNAEPLWSITRRLALDDSHDPDADMRLFLIESFNSLKKRHFVGQNLPPTWPTAEEIGALVRKSSGQFIFAATVVKFVSSSVHSPEERLQIVLGTTGTGNQTPFAELDTLYHQIFSSVDNEDLPKALEIISYLSMVKGTRLTVKDIEDILSYRHGELRYILRDLQSLVFVPDNDDTDVLNLYHASLPDFLTDPMRAGNLYIHENKAIARLGAVQDSEKKSE